MKYILKISFFIFFITVSVLAKNTNLSLTIHPTDLITKHQRIPFDKKGNFQSIPKILHFINLDNRPLLDVEKAQIRSWKDAHPSWQWKIWTKENILALDLYTKDTISKAVSRALKTELIRFEVLHHHGGICIDMDIECLKSFDALVSNCDFFAATTHENAVELKSSLLGAKPGHPVIRSTLDKLQQVCQKQESLIFSINSLLTESFQNVGNQGNKDLVVDSHFFYPVPEVDQQAMIPLDMLRSKYLKNDGQAIQLCHAVVDIVVVVASYNNGSNNHDSCITNLESLRIQKWPYFSVIITDDCSRDNNYELISNYVKIHHLEDKVKVIHNPVRRGALANNYTAIHSIDEKKVVVALDGDDALNGDNALTIVASAYADKRPWLTYGSYIHDTGALGEFSQPVVDDVYKTRAFRKMKFLFSHLRTFYAKLFHLIKIEDLQKNGCFYSVTQDLAFMYPMLEMASQGHIRYIPAAIYIYNSQNPISDFRQIHQQQLEVEEELRKKPLYEPIELW